MVFHRGATGEQDRVHSNLLSCTDLGSLDLHNDSNAASKRIGETTELRIREGFVRAAQYAEERY